MKNFSKFYELFTTSYWTSATEAPPTPVEAPTPPVEATPDVNMLFTPFDDLKSMVKFPEPLMIFRNANFRSPMIVNLCDVKECAQASFHKQSKVVEVHSSWNNPGYRLAATAFPNFRYNCKELVGKTMDYFTRHTENVLTKTGIKSKKPFFSGGIQNSSNQHQKEKN